MLALLLAAIAPVPAASAPPRTLIYAYAYQRSQTDSAEHAYGVDKMDPGGGGTFYFHNVNQHFIAPGAEGAENASGRIAVVIERQESDGGLVVGVRDSSLGGDAAAPATCVAFADTTVVCDPNRPVSPAAKALLGVLGRGFVDPSRIDAQGHWRIEPQGPAGTAADYRILHAANGVIQIREDGVVTHAGSPWKTTIDATIDYDMARALPTSLVQSTVEESRRGAVDETISTQTSLRLVSDSAVTH
ncbi:MAG TPA: hypothetical protein VJP76_00850 [Candidatus Tumulicola sp.]|nr:hypothetical protein [Candidatus Tumulicola sp.]